MIAPPAGSSSATVPFRYSITRLLISEALEKEGLLLATAWFSQQVKYKDVYEVNKLMTKSIVEDFDMLVL